jgi:hypothetical protein
MQPLVNCGSLTHDDMDYIQNMQKRGFSVVVFTPEELDGVRVKHFEDLLIQHGNDLIETVREPE